MLHVVRLSASDTLTNGTLSKLVEVFFSVWPLSSNDLTIGQTNVKPLDHQFNDFSINYT
jgi:hypothetical protein